MIFETIDALELLREHGIRVVRSRYVDSAQDAVFFAEHRPISLRTVSNGHAPTTATAETDLRKSHAIRHAYERIAPLVEKSANGHVLAQRSIESGTDIAIECRNDPKLGPIVEIRSGSHHAHRLAPVDELQAEAMLNEFHAKHGIAPAEKATRMLAHLLLRVCAVFAEAAIERVTLDPIRLHDSTYDVISASVEARHPIALNRRLGKHAHDRRASYQP